MTSQPTSRCVRHGAKSSGTSRWRITDACAAKKKKGITREEGKTDGKVGLQQQ